MNSKGGTEYTAQAPRSFVKGGALKDNEITELKDAVRYLEFKLIEKKQEQEAIMRELQDAHEQSKLHMDEYNRENLKGATQATKINELQSYISDQHNAHNEAIERFSKKFEDYQREIDAREGELARLRARLHHKAEELKVAEIGVVTNQSKILDANQKFQFKSDEVEKLQKDLDQTKQELAEVHATRKPEGQAILEIEHLRADNDRLVKLLRKTKEYKNFAGFAEDNLGSVRFMPIEKVGRYRARKPSPDTIDENFDPNAEEDNWVPQEAFDVAYKYKNEYGGELTDTLINKLLQSLNHVWRNRERRQIARVKTQCNREIGKLRRQIQQTAPLEEVKTKNEISRLKTQLAESQKKLRQAVVIKKKNLRETEVQEHVGKAFQIAGDLQDERNKIVLENKMLRTRLQDAEQLHGDQDFERAKFMQGAAWQATKALDQNKDLYQQVIDLIPEFKSHERSLSSNGNDAGLQLFRHKNHDIVLEEIQQAIEGCNTNLKSMM